MDATAENGAQYLLKKNYSVQQAQCAIRQLRTFERIMSNSAHAPGRCTQFCGDHIGGAVKRYVLFNMDKMELGEPFCRNSAPLVVPDNCILYQLVEVTALNTAERRKTVRAKRPVQQRKVRLELTN